MEFVSRDQTAIKDLPLCVDLDGTLINTDLLMESLFALLRQSPFTMLLVPFWLLRGKAYLKEQIIRRVHIDVTLLPYHAEFLAYLFQLHATGRRLVLATASHLHFAEQVAAYLGIFESVFATDGKENLSRSRKGKCLANLYGERGFDYAGNSRADLAVWPYARAAILVNPVPGVARRVRVHTPVTAYFDDRHALWKTYLKAFALPQWLKNLALFVPLLTLDDSHDLLAAFLRGGVVFLSFGFCTSGVALLSDLLHLPTDRQFPYRRYSALAAGTMSIIHGAVLVPLLLGLGLALVAPLSFEYLALLGGYCLLAQAHFAQCKQPQPIQGALVEVGLYTLRFLAGWIAIGQEVAIP